MIGSDCTSFDEAVERVRAWDKAFVAQVAKALEDEDVPDDEPKVGKAPKQKKKGIRHRLRNPHARIPRPMPPTLRLQDRAIGRHGPQTRPATRPRGRLPRRKTRPQHGRIQRLHHRRIPTRHPIPSIGATYRKRYTHVLLDEYQDTSTTQAALLTALFHADSTIAAR